MTGAFPSRRADGARNPEVLPPPVAPPLRPDRVPPTRPVTFAEPPPVQIDEPHLRGRVGPVGFDTVRGPVVDPDLDRDRDLDPTLEPLPGGYGLTGLGPPPPAGGTTTVRRPRPPRPATAAAPQDTVPYVIPRRVRMRAGVGLVVFTMVTGLGLAMAVLGIVVVGVKALGGV